MTAMKPVVSIGMPVYNGETFLAETLDSLLAQTFSDFELVISDNGSTDQTEAICRSYVEKDGRIRYYREADNHGAAWNYNRVFDLAEGEYFKWAAHDDLLAPEFLARCVDILDRQPQVVLCYPRTRAIDERGAVIKEYPSKTDASAPQAYKRFYEFVCVPHPCVAVFGLIRRNALIQTRLIGNFSSSDRPLLGELSLLGQIYELPDFLFFYRNHPEQSWRQYSTRHLVQAWYDPEKRTRLTFPHWRLLREHMWSIQRVPLTWYDRTQCYLCLGWWVRRNWRHLAKNLVLQDV